MQTGKPDFIWAGLLALGSAWLGYEMVNILRTGVAKGKGGFYHRRDSEPVMYWASVALNGIGAAALAFMGLGFL